MLATCFGGITVASKMWTACCAPSHEPQLPLVGRQADAVARAAVPLDRPLLEARDLDAVQHLPGLEVADLEPEQLVDVHEAQRLRAVDGERPDHVAERADVLTTLWRLGVGDRQQRRLQPGEVDAACRRAT